MEPQPFDSTPVGVSNNTLILPQYKYFPQNFNFLYFHLACLMGYLVGGLCEYLWEKYDGDRFKLWAFDKTTTAFTNVRVIVSPYYADYIAPCMTRVTGKGLYIHDVTLHYKNPVKNQPTLRIALGNTGPASIDALSSGDVTPENFENLYPDNLNDLKAMVIQYSFGRWNPQRFFHVVPYDKVRKWLGAKTFLPDAYRVPNDYSVTKPESESDLLSITIHAYLEGAPLPSQVVGYLKDHPEVFQAPNSMSEDERKTVWSRFFSQKEEIILEDDLGDLVRIGMFE